MRLIRLKNVLGRTGLSRTVLYVLMSKGQFPRPTKLYPGARATGWLEEEIDAYVKDRIAERDA